MTASPQSDPIYVPAGAWARGRWLPRPPIHRRPTGRVQPEWDGAWHLTTGDVQAFHGGRLKVRAVCGYRVTSSLDRDAYDQPYADAVVAETMPLVEVCLRCVRLSGAAVTVAVRERLVTISPVADG